MKIDSNQNDRERFRKLLEIRSMNLDMLEMFNRYLTKSPCFIKEEMVGEIVTGCGISEEESYHALLAAACGLDTESKLRDKQIASRYFVPSVRKLNAGTFRENPYYRNIRVPETKLGSWELKHEQYLP